MPGLKPAHAVDQLKQVRNCLDFSAAHSNPAKLGSEHKFSRPLADPAGAALRLQKNCDPTPISPTALGAAATLGVALDALTIPLRAISLNLNTTFQR